MRIAVVGHVEHITLGRVPRVPGAGEIAHAEDVRSFPGGGGGIAFFQLTRSPAEVHLFTALGNDEAAAQVRTRIDATGARIHAAQRAEPHTRDLVLITPDGERTIVVLGEPLHPRHDDPLPWELLATCDAAYFTGQDRETLRAARAARVLVVTARRRTALIGSGVRADVVVGSASDPREASTLADYPVAPTALVMTEGAAGGRIETAERNRRFAAPKASPPRGGSYGAGDSFAGALTWYVAVGRSVDEACLRSALHGAAVLGSLEPIASQLPLTT
ncbi:MAG TPA: PfkB family carbohydrate kinase [Myxococcales bacterium]|jgi:ribokinase|nr:PfkB family carbohydrate kinase [Myxococcales bacterium]